MAFKEVLKCNVAASESNTGKACVLCKKTYEVIVSSAAEHSADVFGMLVKHLEYRAGIVVKSSDYSKIKDAVFFKIECAKRLKEHDKLL